MSARSRSGGKSKRPASITDTADMSAGSSSSAGTKVSKLDPTGLYDMQQVKRVLDDNVIWFLESKGYEELTFASNVKIVTGVVAIIAAVLSHFNGREFPENRALVAGCVAVYSLCVAVVYVVSYLCEGDAFYVAQLSNTASLSADDDTPKQIWVQSAVGHKGNSNFKLTLRLTVRTNESQTVTLSKPYEEYFYETGELALQVLSRDLAELVQKAARLRKKE